MLNSSILPIERIPSGTIRVGLSGHGSNGNEGVLCIPQRSSITGALASDDLMSYLGHSCQGVGMGSYPSAEMQ